MREADLCKDILGLTPTWTVATVDLDVSGRLTEGTAR